MDSTTNTGNFSGANNLGSQVSQNFGVISTGAVHVHSNPAPEREEWTKERCHQLFRLTQAGGGEGYEWYKNRIDERIEGTCAWFLNHEKYLAWKYASSGPLFVSADPGCGKSVLAKYLIEHELPGSICYFFFKDQDQNTLKQLLCALLHQLFSHHPSLIEHAVLNCKKNGEQLIEHPEVLWEILISATKDLASPVTFVLDALDECLRSDLERLSRWLKIFFNGLHPHTVKFLFTSRPYQEIVYEICELAERFPGVHIPGEEHSDQISKEVDCMVVHRVNQIATKFNLKKELKECLKERLSRISHRTYLWVYLMFDHLNRGFRKTKTGIMQLIDTLPESVNEAYEKILTRSTDEESVRTSLSIIVGAERPLTLKEMNIAVHLMRTPRPTTWNDLDLEDEADFKNTLRDWCGLFVSVYGDRVYLIHQTAREFLLPKVKLPARSSSQPWIWCGSISFETAHANLADICVTYLNFKQFEEYASDMSSHSSTEVSLRSANLISQYQEGKILPFFDYSAESWPGHFQSAGQSIQPTTVSLALNLLHVTSEEQKPWFFVFRQRKHDKRIFDGPNFHNPLILATCLSLDKLVDRICQTHDVNGKAPDRRTALHFAAERGFLSTCRLLIEHGASINLQGPSGRTPLHWAAQASSEEVVNLLLNFGADVSLRTLEGNSALHDAARYGSSGLIGTLLAHGLDPNERNRDGASPFITSIVFHNEDAGPNFLKYGADVEAKDHNGKTPLYFATRSPILTELLLSKGANIRNVYPDQGLSALHAAVLPHKNETVCQILLDHGAEINAVDLWGQTPLHRAMKSNDWSLTQMLLAYGANIDKKDFSGRTPLIKAARFGMSSAIKLLLQHGAAVDMQSLQGKTALHKAVECWSMDTAQELLKAGASANIQDREGSTALHLAVRTDLTEAARMLLNYGASISIRDKVGRTAWDLAVDRANEDMKVLFRPYYEATQDNDHGRFTRSST